MSGACVLISGAPDATPEQAAPPQYDSISHVHRVQHYDSPEWQDLDPNACFGFHSLLPDDDDDDDTELEWEARLRVKARDLPRLMREGFHWSAANFDFEASYIQTDLSGEEETIRMAGWTCSRSFFLSDLGDDPRWAAKLVVWAQNTGVLSRFKIADLTPDMMSWAFAWRKSRQCDGPQWLYDWDCDEPQDSFNAIYGEMPLDGWWPWPKRDDDTMLEFGRTDGS